MRAHTIEKEGRRGSERKKILSQKKKKEREKERKRETNEEEAVESSGKRADIFAPRSTGRTLR